MRIMEYFKPVDTWSMDKVRQFLSEMSSQDYNLVDRRTRKEYEQGHLPGTRLIPLAELGTRLKELDRTKRFKHSFLRGSRL